MAEAPRKGEMSFRGIPVSAGVAGVVRAQASRQLGPFHSPHIELRQAQTLITQGIYRIARHPYYGSVIMELVGFNLFLNTLRSLFVVGFIYFPLMLFRIKREELFMAAHFGDTYQRYAASTPRLVPRIRWRRDGARAHVS